MMETLETPGAAQLIAPAAQGEGDAQPVERSGVAPTEQVGGPFFADLVRAHYAWERLLADKKEVDPDRLEQLDRAYHDTLQEFSTREGEILEAYWCTREASAVVLTEKPQTRIDRLRGESHVRIHRVSNWVMPRTAQKLADLLHDCDELAIRAGEILRGTPKRIALRSTYEVESHVLAFLERTRGKPTDAEITEFGADVREAMRATQECYKNAADKVARMVYVSGMIAGVAVLPAIAALAGLAVWIFGALHLHSAGTQAFFACFAAGALGAVVSVLSRMASPDRFGLDPEIGRRALFFLGIYRPLVGSIFGLALYFLLQSSLLQSSLLPVAPDKKFATLVVAAFLGGFSERFVKIMLHGAEKTMGNGSSGNASRPKAAGNPSPSAQSERPER
jgi:hypothetical protein